MNRHDEASAFCFTCQCSIRGSVPAHMGSRHHRERVHYSKRAQRRGSAR